MEVRRPALSLTVVPGVAPSSRDPGYERGPGPARRLHGTLASEKRLARRWPGFVGCGPPAAPHGSASSRGSRLNRAPKRPTTRHVPECARRPHGCACWARPPLQQRSAPCDTATPAVGKCGHTTAGGGGPSRACAPAHLYPGGISRGCICAPAPVLPPPHARRCAGRRPRAFSCGGRLQGSLGGATAPARAHLGRPRTLVVRVRRRARAR